MLTATHPPLSALPLQLLDPRDAGCQIQHRRHQRHRHDQSLNDLLTHLLPPLGRATLPATTDRHADTHHLQNAL